MARAKKKAVKKKTAKRKVAKNAAPAKNTLQKILVLPEKM